MGYTLADMKGRLPAGGAEDGRLYLVRIAARRLHFAGAQRPRILGKGLKSVGFTVKELKAVGFDLAWVKLAGYDLIDLVDAGFTQKHLSQVGYSDKDLKPHFRKNDNKVVQ